MWPSLHDADLFFTISNWGLIVGLVLVAVATVGAVWMANVREEYLKRELSGANERIAVLDTRAKEAELALAELSSPRSLDHGSFTKALEGITPEKVEILYADACSDCFWLAQWIFNFLGPQGGIGWPISKLEPLQARADGRFASLPLAMAAHANPWGVTVVAPGTSNNWGDNSAASALLRAIATSMGKRPLVSGSLDAELPKGTVRIVVAPKT